MDTLNRIYQVLNKKEKRDFKFLFMISFITMFLETLSISMLIPLLNLVLASDVDNSIISNFLLKFEGIDLLNYPFILLILILCVFFFKTIVLIYFTYFKNKFIYNFRASLSSRIYENLTYSDYDYFLNTNSSIIINYLSKEIDEFISLVDSGITFFTEAIIITGLLVFIILYEPLSIYAMLFFALFAISIYLITKNRIENWGNKRQHHDGLRAKAITEIVDGIKEIKLSQKEEYFLKKFNVHNFGSSMIGKKISTVVQIPRILLEFMGVFALIILIFSLKLYGVSNEETLVILGILAAISFRILPSLNRILNTSQALKFGKTVVYLVYKLIFEMKPRIKIKNNNIFNFKNFREINLKNIIFSYGSSKNRIIDNLSLKIKSGEMIGIKGKTGGGKTTFLNILCGIIFPKSGKILVDDQNILENVAEWQNMVSYVPQNTFLIDDTIKKNIALGIEDMEMNIEKIDHAIEQAGLKLFVNSLDHKSNTIIGERGIKLSGGQKQRLGIARALYRDSEILILDEITSSLDEKTENEIIEEIKNFVPRKTIIMVSHKNTSLKYCKNIYEFYNGNLNLAIK